MEGPEGAAMVATGPMAQGSPSVFYFLSRSFFFMSNLVMEGFLIFFVHHGSIDRFGSVGPPSMEGYIHLWRHHDGELWPPRERNFFPTKFGRGEGSVGAFGATNFLNMIFPHGIWRKLSLEYNKPVRTPFCCPIWTHGNFLRIFGQFLHPGMMENDGESLAQLFFDGIWLSGSMIWNFLSTGNSNWS